MSEILTEISCEMGFTLGGVDELVDPRVKLLYAVDTDGKVLGVTHRDPWIIPFGCLF